MSNRAPHYFTREEILFIKKNITGRSYADLTELFNRRFGLRGKKKLSARQIGNAANRRGLRTGCNGGRFVPGMIPHNKGKKGICAPGSEKGWFKPGHKTFNAMPVGSEKIDPDGYVEIKYSEKSGPHKNRWKSKHTFIWEKTNGPVPEGHVVVFADGNRRNFKPENLVLVSRKELGVLNHESMLSSKNGEIAKASVLLARLKCVLSARKKATLETRGNRKLVIVDNRGSRITVARDRETGGYFPVRETKRGPRQLKTALVKSRETIREARDDLIAYALKRGWQRL